MKEQWEYFEQPADGKWMMFFKNKEIKEAWDQATAAMKYLKSISHLKLSKYPKKDTYVICYYCGPSNDEHKVMKQGYNILKHVKYDKPLYYKSNKQSEKRGKVNHLYKINTYDSYMFVDE